MREGLSSEDYNPLARAISTLVAVVVVIVMAIHFYVRNERRPAVHQVLVPGYSRPASCPDRDYSFDYFVYRGCADPRYKLDGYAFGIDPLEWGGRGTSNKWYRIGNDAFDLDCSVFDPAPCTNRAVVKNLFAQGPHGPRLSYYRCGLDPNTGRRVC